MGDANSFSNMKTLKPASIGTVIAGTLRTEGLLSALLSELGSLTLRSGVFLSQPGEFPTQDYFARVIGDAQDCFTDDGETLSEDGESDAPEVLSELHEALDLFAPPYCYFGAHPGDGADFGFWPSLESIEELPTVEDSDGAKALGEDCKAVNDHGNVTVYGGDGRILLELV